MKLRVILTGATGMVGEGVLLECLNSPEVEEVLSISRRPSGHTHPKLREIIHSDFQNLTPVQDQLTGYNACFFCLGVSSVGMKEPEYRRLTQDLTLHFAQTLLPRNPGLTFC
ncbi:NAD-dependent epimerase/dehydratase family protein [Hymenobacter lutimineralis]|uniref:NAD-dependent epimerase/dehydratase family protein n=1 Tax=Hymenobacter lutimineralis TaxID=2606448 RepID=UPI0027E51F4D|nr:NAD-dependent epimerase/dehydratase family protein [Hymenobacter lutimineralis]